MKVYRGYRQMHLGIDGTPVSSQCVVTVELAGGQTRPLNPRIDIRNHSPAGFEWGYAGSGPAQLALALVADACGKRLAVAPIYQRVKAKIVAGLPHEGWVLTQEQIKAAVEAARREVGEAE